MADKAFKLEVITPDRMVLSDTHIVSVLIPGVNGYLGIWAYHAPMMTQTKIGKLELQRADGTSDVMAISEGFVEIFENKVTILAETAELASEIDIERAEQAASRAKENLQLHSPNIDIDQARMALIRAINRIDVARYRS